MTAWVKMAEDNAFFFRANSKKENTHTPFVFFVKAEQVGKLKKFW
jgi:hypothetical protein